MCIGTVCVGTVCVETVCVGGVGGVKLTFSSADTSISYIIGSITHMVSPHFRNI